MPTSWDLETPIPAGVFLRSVHHRRHGNGLITPVSYKDSAFAGPVADRRLRVVLDLPTPMASIDPDLLQLLEHDQISVLKYCQEGPPPGLAEHVEVGVFRYEAVEGWLRTVAQDPSSGAWGVERDLDGVHGVSSVWPAQEVQFDGPGSLAIICQALTTFSCGT